MPKIVRAPSDYSNAASLGPYSATSNSGQRNAAIWSTTDDEILMQARASGLNWQPISSKHFPNKTANACRKRHERLMERRHAEDWDSQKLDLLAQEYMACRREMWEVLASRVGERWTVIEAKCMEKGLKTLQATARISQRRASVGFGQCTSEQGNAERHSEDSGIGISPDAETGAGDETASTRSATWPAPIALQQMQQPEHSRSMSLPQPLPLYQPPPPIVRPLKPLIDVRSTTTNSNMMTFGGCATAGFRRYTPEPGRSGISIRDMLASPEVRRV